MKNIKNKLDEKLHSIRSLILDMGDLVGQSISLSSEVFLKGRALIKELRLREKKINALQLKISKECFKVLAQEAPVARDLRLIISIVHANTDLERMGDLALNIAKRTQGFKRDSLLEEPLELFARMFEQVIRMVHHSLEAFVEENEEQARKILKADARVNQIRDDIRKKLEMVTSRHQHLIRPGIDLVLIVGEIERIADHVTNIAEEIIFFKTGDDIRHLSSLSSQKTEEKKK